MTDTTAHAAAPDYRPGDLVRFFAWGETITARVTARVANLCEESDTGEPGPGFLAEDTASGARTWGLDSEILDIVNPTEPKEPIPVQQPTNDALRTLLVELIERAIRECATATVFDPKGSTGGNCWAMCLDLEGRKLEITDGDSDLPFSDTDFRDLVFTYFTAEGDPDGQCTVEWGVGDYWDNADVTLRSWLAGDPYRDLMMADLRARYGDEGQA
jgi:hypothetical protein